MMKSVLLSTVTALAMAVAAPVMAANTALILWNDANPGGFETASGTDTADLTGTNLGGVTLTLSFVNRGTNPNDLTEGNINIQNTTSTVQTLRIIAGANGFFGPTTSGFGLSATILTALGSSDLTGSFFADASNSLNGTDFSVTGTDLGDFDSGTLLGPHSFAFNSFAPDVLNGPYGLAESLTLVLQPGASIGVQSISMDAVSQVPEPKTWAMMAVGFGMLALFGVKRRKGRLATI